MGDESLQSRTRQFALRVIKLVASSPRADIAREIGRQLLRSGMSVGANYRAACRGRSGKEFRAKLGIVEEETDESVYWMELLMEAEIVSRSLLDDLINEGHEILAMVVASIRTSRSNNP